MSQYFSDEMATLTEQILVNIKRKPGLSDRQLTDIIKGKKEPQQTINATCRRLASKGKVIRSTRPDGRIGNFLAHNVSKVKQKKTSHKKAVMQILWQKIQ